MPLNNVIASILPELAVAGVQAVTRGGPRRQYKWNKKAAEDANVMNRANQQWLLEQNRILQEEQREYDSAASQMARYKAAGLNPHLIYGSGSSSAGGTFPIDAGGVPGVNVAPPSASYPDVGGSFIRAGQALANTALAEARTSETAANEALKLVQVEIAKTNPMLSPDVAGWVSTAMMETARLKSLESRSWMANVYGTQVHKITAKVNAELESMIQRLGLNAADLAIKNKVFESKEFENAVKEINAKWLQDASVSPEHIRQGMMLLLSKMLGR